MSASEVCKYLHRVDHPKPFHSVDPVEKMKMHCISTNQSSSVNNWRLKSRDYPVKEHADSWLIQPLIFLIDYNYIRSINFSSFRK